MRSSRLRKGYGGEEGGGGVVVMKEVEVVERKR